MSLSFVKSAVLSSTDGVSHNEETTIDNKETQSLRASGGGFQKPLFEQLRANKDAELEKDEEFQRSIRGTRPLDEEDCAHLDAVDRRREDNEYAVKSGIEHEVALFHAAREDRGLAQTVMSGADDNDDNARESVVRDDAAVKTEHIAAAKKDAKKIVPKFTIKKKRKRVAQENGSNSAEKNNLADHKKKSNSDACATKGSTEIDVDITKPSSKAKNDSDSDNGGGGLLGLGCYDSDSDNGGTSC